MCKQILYHIEEQKDAVSEYLDKRFGKWYNDIYMTLDLAVHY